ncbi:AAA family ATPase [Streptomyces sp. NPDC005963]|uniref:helix-turn-helix transcriptional regulator n=1 Tax=Streptomyces sp. NPDC005963 TaxID=3156721 RepID=UPI0033C0C6EA
MENRSDQQRSLIGRAGQIAVLARLLRAARTGRPTAVLIEGPAGSGKTALAGHVLAAGGAGPVQPALSRDFGPTVPAAAPVGPVPLVSLVPPAAPGSSGQGAPQTCTTQELRIVQVSGAPWEAGLPLGVMEQLARACAPAPDPEPAPGPAPANPVLEAAGRLHRLWTQAQRHGPLAVVVDDAHWADPESLRAIDSAVRAFTTERILVLLIARDDLHGPHGEVPPRTLELLDRHRDGSIRLGPLGPEEIRELARVAADLTLSLRATRHLRRHTLGNPRHLLRLFRELPRDVWQEWQPALPAPARYTADIRQRLARCGAETRALVEACSVLVDGDGDGDGGSDEVPVVAAAALADLDDALPAADEACAAGLLTATVEPGRTLLSFPHPLTRAAVRTGIGLARRRELHRRAADIADDPGLRLTHRAAATTADADLAAELDRYAAERASAGEWAAVADALVRAGRLSTDRADRQDRLLRAVDAMIAAGDVPRAAVFAAELESFPASTLRDVVLGYLAIMRGRAAEAETFLTQAEARCDTELRPELMARISQRRVLHALGRWDAPALVTWARRALECAEPGDPSAIESEAVLGLGLAALGRPAEAVAVYERALAKDSGGAQSQRFRLGRGWVDLAHDAPEAARRELEGAVPTGYRMGSTRISLWAQAWLARTQFALGSWPEALETVDRAAARLAEVRIELVRPAVHWTGAQIHALRGDWAAAERHLEEASAGMDHYEVMVVPSCLARAQVAEARGDYAQVVEALAPVVRLPDRTGIDEPGFWPWPDVYANALVMTHRIDEADAFLAPHEDLAARREHRSTQARLGLVRGRITAARGDVAAARMAFETALAHLDGLPLPYDRARVNFAYGQTLRRAGKRRDADTVLKNARDAYRALGARTYTERCDRELQAGGVSTARGGLGPSSLTAQEQAVARLVAQGASNQRTASELFISVKTVQYHLTRIYAKLGIRSRGELAARCHEAGRPEGPDREV